MNKKLYVTDLDGTIVYENHEMKQEDIDAVKNLRASGHYMAVATGRDLAGLMEFDTRIKIPFDFYILSNGALILDRDFNVLQETPIDKQVALTIIDDYFKQDKYFIATSNGREMTVVERIYENFQMGEYRSVVQYTEFMNNPPEILFLNLQPYDRDADDAIEKAMVLNDEINERYGDVAECYRNRFFLDIGPKGISKGSAIQYLLKETGLAEKDVTAIGDSWNDVSMFALKDVNSYSFDYAEQGVQALAKNIVPGTAACIAEFLK